MLPVAASGPLASSAPASGPLAATNAATRLPLKDADMSQANGFWQDRRVFVTGCTGLVGAWTVRALLERGAHVVGLVRDQVAGSELVRGGLLERIDVVHGGVEDYALVERALAEYEVQTVIHLAAP